MQKKLNQGQSNGANLGFEDKLWKAADKLRSNMDAAEYKHVVLGLLFLKYISDAFTELHEQLESDPTADPEDVDEYVSKKGLLGSERGKMGLPFEEREKARDWQDNRRCDG